MVGATLFGASGVLLASTAAVKSCTEPVDETFENGSWNVMF